MPLDLDTQSTVSFIPLPSRYNITKIADEADASLLALRKKIQSMETVSALDLTDEEFHMMSTPCIEGNVGEYTYKVCPFKDIHQGSTLLGKWKERGDMEWRFDQGNHCWNHGARKATVKLECGEENKILDVYEPNTCDYVVEMTSPVVC